MNELTLLRARRTRASNRARHTITFMLTGEAPTMYDGLPSWWPFWSDCLKNIVRETVREARALEVAEGRTSL